MIGRERREAKCLEDPTYTDGNLQYLREKYAIGFITIEELEEGLDSVLNGGPVNVPKARRGH